MKIPIARIALGLLAPVSLFLCGCPAVPAQTPVPIPITGNLGDIAGSPTPDAYVTITLQGCTGGNPTVTGFQGIVQTSARFVADTNGDVNGTIWPNSVITCSGTTGGTVYARTVVSGDVPVGQTLCYSIAASQGVWNLNTQQAVTCTGTPPNPQDVTYRNIAATGNISAPTATIPIVTGHATLDMPIAGGDFTGAISAPVATIATVNGHATLDMPLTGGTFTGDIAVPQVNSTSGYKIGGQVVLDASPTQPVSCSIGQFWTNPSATSPYSVAYVCYPLNTWVAVKTGVQMTGTPTRVADAGAGTGPTITIAAGSTDGAGYVTVLTGTTPSASTGVVTITFSQTYAVQPRCWMYPAGTNSAALTGAGAMWLDQASLTTSQFVIRVGSTPLTAATSYIIGWGCQL